MIRRLSAVGASSEALRSTSTDDFRPRVPLCKWRALALKLIIILIVVALIIAFTLPSFSNLLDEELYPADGPLSFRDAADDEAYSWLRTADEARAVELKRILASVRRDLLNAARQLATVNAEFEAVTKQLSDRKSELKVLEQEIEETKLLQKEMRDSKNVPVFLPNAPPARDPSLDSYIPHGSSLEEIFDFSRCSIAGGFGVYLYEIIKNASEQTRRYHREFSLLPQVTYLAENACIFVVIVEEDAHLTDLKYWRNGTNHVIVNVGSSPIVTPSNAIIISSRFKKKLFRRDVDILLNLNVPEYRKNEWRTLPQILPLSRKHLLSFEGAVPEAVEKLLELMLRSAERVDDSFYFNLNCSTQTSSFGLCHSEEERGAVLYESMFVLIFVNESDEISDQFPKRLLEALKHTAVPVVVSLVAPLPLEDVIDWRRIVFRIAPQRLPELHFILRSFSPSDILEMRRRARFVLENYFANTKVVTSTLVSVLRQRIGVPGRSCKTVRAEPLFGQSFSATRTVPVGAPQFEEEYLGPREAPHSSPSYTHNFTALQMYSYFFWNEMGAALSDSLEYLTVEPPFPSEFEFGEGAVLGFRPIAPGSGVEFSAAIGGNRPREQFTVVLLTFRRDAVLHAALERLNNMPYLNKVLVVWNNDEPPSDRAWPRLHVPVLFIKAAVNSLNNRFLPYDQIETEAVLSLDDDIDLKQHEIIFAFRVWREQRTKIVGFPARHHARYNGEMYYNSNHTCQHSMILTGAAFIHKWYMYAYTYQMPEIIREKVDEWMNCEDLAMNFLVSHLTRQPPIKTTSKWTLRCATCSEMLSQDASHFTERHECIRFFTRVFGYNPLLFSQFRVDSVLFKTRLPPNHQKCFKYV